MQRNLRVGLEALVDPPFINNTEELTGEPGGPGRPTIH